MTEEKDYSVVDTIKNHVLHTSDGGYLIPREMMDGPIYTPLWRNWFGCLLLRWFKIRDRSKDTSMLRAFSLLGDDGDD